MTYANIKAAIDVEIEARKARLGISADMVVQELALIAFANIADFIMTDERGAIRARPLVSVEDRKRKIFRKIKDNRVIKSTPEGSTIMNGTFEFELFDKLRGLELLGKHLGMFRKRQEVDVTQPVVVTIREFYKGDPIEEGKP